MGCERCIETPIVYVSADIIRDIPNREELFARIEAAEKQIRFGKAQLMGQEIDELLCLIVEWHERVNYVTYRIFNQDPKIELQPDPEIRMAHFVAKVHIHYERYDLYAIERQWRELMEEELPEAHLHYFLSMQPLNE